MNETGSMSFMAGLFALWSLFYHSSHQKKGFLSGADEVFPTTDAVWQVPVPVDAVPIPVDAVPIPE